MPAAPSANGCDLRGFLAFVMTGRKNVDREVEAFAVSCLFDLGLFDHDRFGDFDDDLRLPRAGVAAANGPNKTDRIGARVGWQAQSHNGDVDYNPVRVGKSRHRVGSRLVEPDHETGADRNGRLFFDAGFRCHRSGGQDRGAGIGDSHALRLGGHGERCAQGNSD
jgi:hypothetical protein